MNSSVSSQIAQTTVGPGKVLISIVLYIEATSIKRGIPFLLIYCKFISLINTLYNIDVGVIYYTIV